MDTIINKVAESGIITVDLIEYLPKEEILFFDLKPFLFMELILKEKDFRKALQELDWTVYQDKYVAVNCSVDVIIPVWAYMLVAVYLEPFAKDISFSSVLEMKEKILLDAIKKVDVKEFEGQRVVIKGCGDEDVPTSAYLAMTYQLKPVAKSIMYGEPCSTVPIFKKK